MKIYPIEAGNFKLDGGAMFGVVPKKIWEKTNPADEDNLIEMSCRCLLIENENRLILVDTGLEINRVQSFLAITNYGENTLSKIHSIKLVFPKTKSLTSF